MGPQDPLGSHTKSYHRHLDASFAKNKIINALTPHSGLKSYKNGMDIHTSAIILLCLLCLGSPAGLCIGLLAT